MPNQAIDQYMNEVELSFIYSPIISTYHIREKKILAREGYIRIKAQLTNDDIFEAFEFVIMVEEAINIITYRLQWHKYNGALMGRWDNAEHHKEVYTFPYHFHDGISGGVLSSEKMSIKKALDVIEEEISRES